jgi:hypothetical protein
MNENSDKQWLDRVAAHYVWPEPSAKIKRNVLKRTQALNKNMAMPYDFFVDVFTFNLRSAIALSAALILGLSVGQNILDQSIGSAQASIYLDSGLMSAQLIVDNVK